MVGLVEAHQNFGMLSQALGNGLQHQIVDGILLAGFGQQHLAELHQLGDVHLDVLGHRRDLGVRSQHTLGNHLTHTGQLHHGVAFHQFQTGLRRFLLGGSGCCGRSGSGRVLLSLSGSQNVLHHDTAGGASTCDAGIVNAHLGRSLAGQRRNADALAVGSHGSGCCGRSGSSCGCSLSGRSGSGCSRGVAHSLAGLADVSQQALNGDVLPFLRHDLQQHAVVLAGDLVGQFIGGDLHDHITSLYLIALVLDPLGNCAFLHGQAQLRHQYFISHDSSTLLTCSARA